jgi:hypothetical protein
LGEIRLRRNDVAPWAQMMLQQVANDVGLRPMMLRRCRKLRKLFATAKSI